MISIVQMKDMSSVYRESRPESSLRKRTADDDVPKNPQLQVMTEEPDREVVDMFELSAEARITSTTCYRQKFFFSLSLSLLQHMHFHRGTEICNKNILLSALLTLNRIAKLCPV